MAQTPLLTITRFDEIKDKSEKAYFMNLPTSFVLPAEDVDRLRQLAGQLLRQSAEYKSVVRDFGGNVLE